MPGAPYVHHVKAAALAQAIYVVHAIGLLQRTCPITRGKIYVDGNAASYIHRRPKTVSRMWLAQRVRYVRDTAPNVSQVDTGGHSAYLEHVSQVRLIAGPAPAYATWTYADRLTTRFLTPHPGVRAREYYGKSRYRREIGFPRGTQSPKSGRGEDLEFPRCLMGKKGRPVKRKTGI